MRRVLASLAVVVLASVSFGADAVSPAQGPIEEAKYAGKIKVACVGDSITLGVGTNRVSNKFPNAYPAQLQRMLGEKYDVQNYGVSGRTLLNKGDKPYQKEKELTKALEAKPDVVIVMLGTNDSKPQNWEHKAEFDADYRGLVEKFLALESKPRLFVCTPPLVAFDGFGGINEPVVQEQLPIIKAIAKEEGAGLIDMHSVHKGKEALIPDKVHPSTEGATLMAKEVYKALTGKEYAGADPVLAPKPATAPAK